MSDTFKTAKENICGHRNCCSRYRAFHNALPTIYNQGNTEVANIKVIYIIYLLQSALSYWFYSYKNTILQADQRQYVATLVGYFITLSVHLLQISVLLLVQYTNLIKAQTGFVVYLIVNLVFVVVKNIVISKEWTNCTRTCLTES